MIIGVTGFFAAGKDSFAAYLERKGFQHISLSDIIREELRRRGLEINVANLTAIGNELRRKQGHGVLGKLAAQRMEGGADYIVTSIRHPDEVRELRAAAPDFQLIFLTASLRVRFERSRARSRSGDPLDFAEFEAAERRQLESGDPAAQQLLACRALADCELNNDSTLEDFHRQLDALLERRVS